VSEGIADDLRRSRPAMACEADYGRSAKKAIQLFCMHCMGGNRGEAVGCKTFSCFLWPYRPSAKKSKLSRPDGCIPSEQEYDDLRNASRTDAQIAATKRLVTRMHGD